MIPQPGRKQGFGKGSCRDGRWQQDASALYFMRSLWHAWTCCWGLQPGGHGHAGAVTPPCPLPLAHPRHRHEARGRSSTPGGQGQGWGQGPTTELPVPQAGRGEAQHRGDVLGHRRSHRCASGTSTASCSKWRRSEGRLRQQAVAIASPEIALRQKLC